MKLKFRKYQEGGAMPEEQAVDEVPVGQEQEQAPTQQDPMQMMLQFAVDAVQNQNCESAMQACAILLEMMQQQQAQQEQMTPENSAPVYRRGGVLVKRVMK